MPSKKHTYFTPFEAYTKHIKYLAHTKQFWHIRPKHSSQQVIFNLANESMMITKNLNL